MICSFVNSCSIFPGEKCLAEFALQRLLASQEVVARKLLRQCAATAGRIRRSDKPRNGSQEAAVVDAGMLEETPVLGSDKRVYDVLRQILIGNRNASTLADLADQVAIAAEDAQRHLQRNVANGLRGRQARLHIIIGADNAGDGRDSADRPNPSSRIRLRRTLRRLM